MSEMPASHIEPIVRRFSLQCADRTVPVTVWEPHGPCQGIVLASHGGSGHRESPAVLAIVEQLKERKICIVAIDGPVHGQRRADGNLDPAEARLAFRDAWRTGVGVTWMAQDWSAALDAVLANPAYQEVPIAYIGVSMGTAYGVPLLAKEPRIEAAVIGLWSTTYPGSAHLESFAQEVRCPTWFTVQWNDEFFERDGAFALFDALGCEDKRLVAYPGKHKELEGQRLRDAIDFVMRQFQKIERHS